MLAIILGTPGCTTLNSAMSWDPNHVEMVGIGAAYTEPPRPILAPDGPVIDPRPVAIAWIPEFPPCAAAWCAGPVWTEAPTSIGIGHTLESLDYRYHWNAHATRGAGTASTRVRPSNAVRLLERDSTYTFHVTLTVPPDGAAGVISVGASEVLATAVKDAADDDNTTLQLTPVVLADRDYFDAPRMTPSVISLDIVGMRAAAHQDLTERLLEQDRKENPWMHQAIEVEISPTLGARLEAIGAASELLPSHFAHFSFVMTTRRRAGIGTVAVSLWQDATPLDEVVFQFCVRGKPEECEGHSAASSRSGGGFLMGLQEFESHSAERDAGLHLVETGANAVVGVLRMERDEGDYDTHSWNLRGPSEALRDAIRKFQNRSQPTADDSADLLHALFSGRSMAASRARKEFARFTTQVGARVHQRKTDRPTMAFRFLSSLTRPLLYPLAQVKPADDAPALGYSFRVLHSLQYPKARRTQSCVRDWWPLVDPDPTDNTLKDALEALNQDAYRFKYNAVNDQQEFRPWRNSDQTFPLSWDLREFGAKLKSRTEWKPQGLVLLGHHGEGTFSFDPTTQEGPRSVTLTGNLIVSEFAPPSFALLAMCSSADVGWNSLVEALSQAGVETVIASTTKIDGRLAGHFIGCFFDSVGSATYGEIAVVDAFERTLMCLTAIHRYGDEVLSFVLAGNPYLMLCSQPKEPLQ